MPWVDLLRIDDMRTTVTRSCWLAASNGLDTLIVGLQEVKMRVQTVEIVIELQHFTIDDRDKAASHSKPTLHHW